MTPRMLKSLFTAAIFTSAIVHQSRAELQIRITSADFIGQNQFRVVAQIFNIGNEVVVQIPYGEAAVNFPQYLRTDVYAEYRKPTSQGITKTLPLSITIKTLFGTSIPAEYLQRIAPTGTTTYYEWEIVFDIPIQALDISLNILGVTQNVKDSKFAKRYEKEATKSGNLAMQDGDELFAQGKYKEAIQKYMIAGENNEQTFPKFAPNLTEAFYQVGDTSLSGGDLEEAFEDLGIARGYARGYRLPSASKIDKRLALCYAKLGQRSTEHRSYGDALWLFRNALDLDATNAEAQWGFRQVESMKRSPILAGFSGLLPGGGQLYNAAYIKAGIFSVGVIIPALVAIPKFNKIRDLDDRIQVLEKQLDTLFLYKYIDISTAVANQRDNLRQELNSTQTSANIFFGIAVIAFGYSIYDAVTEAISYNTKFEPTNSIRKYQLSFIPSSKGATLSLRIHL